MKEIWKSIKGFEGFYEVSNLGRVRSLDRHIKASRGNGTRLMRGKIIKQCNSVGYLKVILTNANKKRQVKVHILVGESFLNYNPKDKTVIDHIDNNRTNNIITNLQIISHRKNISKGYKNKKTNSKYTGVYYTGHNTRGKDWRAIIKINNKTYNLGSYDNEIDAHNAYQNKLKELTNYEKTK